MGIDTLLTGLGICRHHTTCLLCPTAIEQALLQQVDMFQGGFIMTIHQHALDDALGTATAFLSVEDTLLDVEHITLGGVDES